MLLVSSVLETYKTNNSTQTIMILQLNFTEQCVFYYLSSILFSNFPSFLHNYFLSFFLSFHIVQLHSTNQDNYKNKTSFWMRYRNSKLNMLIIKPINSNPAQFPCTSHLQKPCAKTKNLGSSQFSSLSPHPACYKGFTCCASERAVGLRQTVLVTVIWFGLNCTLNLFTGMPVCQLPSWALVLFTFQPYSNPSQNNFSCVQI